MTSPAPQAKAAPRPLRVLALVGSLRAGSYNRMLLRAALDLAPDGMAIEEFGRLREIPPYDGDVDAAGAPQVVAALKGAIAGAHALLVVTPEYNYSVPGVLKNAIDWASRPAATTPLKGKPAAIMGASTGISGTLRAQLHLRQIFQFTQTYPLLQPEVVVQRAQEHFDASGRLTNETTRTIVRTVLEALVAWTEKLGARDWD